MITRKNYEVENLLNSLSGDILYANKDISRLLNPKCAFIYGYIYREHGYGRFIYSNNYVDKIAEVLNISNHMVKTGLKNMHDFGLIELNNHNPESVKKLITNKKDFEGCGIGDKQCEWCGINTVYTHNHHYPIRKEDGGTKTVDICPNCHQEFHGLDNSIMLIPLKEVDIDEQ